MQNLKMQKEKKQDKTLKDKTLIDMHIHSSYSQDGEGTPSEIVKVLRKRGLGGMAITDHNSIKGSLDALKLNSPDFLVIPGIEVTTTLGHILGYGVKENIKERISPEETVEEIRDKGGIAVIPHPIRWRTGLSKKDILHLRGKLSGIEAFNSRSTPKKNEDALTLAENLGLGITGGSDAHFIRDAGKGYTLFDSPYNVDDVLQQIEKKQTSAEGKRIPFMDIVFHSIKVGYLFVKRGFRGV
jgi:hypothetical protein